jgi:hypothetical protein
VRTQGQAAWQLSARLYERQEDICMRGMRSASAFAADKRSQLTDLALIMWAVSQGCHTAGRCRSAAWEQSHEHTAA